MIKYMILYHTAKNLAEHNIFTHAVYATKGSICNTNMSEKVFQVEIFRFIVD